MINKLNSYNKKTIFNIHPYISFILTILNLIKKNFINIFRIIFNKFKVSI